MSNHKSLRFFNKEGDYLNFSYNDLNERFEGDILFHQNSTDTFKTSAVYMLEDIPSFEFEADGLTTNKFQLFNEFGFHFWGSKWSKQIVERIEPVNNDPDFYTKWIFGSQFDAKFPIGTIIQFDSPILEFTNLTQTYVVVGTKPGAIMILSQMDNATFESTFYVQYSNDSIFSNLTISGLNAFGVYDYVDSDFNDRLSRWNEQQFYTKYFDKKKLNIVGSQKNDGIFTVSDFNLSDLLHYEYSVSRNDLPQNSDLIIEVITRTDVPKIYSGELTFTGNRILLNGEYPQILKPGTEFKVVGSTENTNFFTVAEIPVFDTINSSYYFATGSQVVFNNKVFQCTQAYTYSFGDSGLEIGNAFITPANPGWWSLPTEIKVNEMTTNESLLNSQIYLTTDRYYWTFGWTQSSEVTLASAAEKFKDDLSLFNIDLFYLNRRLRADLVYPSNYSIVNFYHTLVGPTTSIGDVKETKERIVEVSEKFNTELNYDFSKNKKYNIIFTDLDEFGFSISVNGMIYDIETSILRTGALIDMERTIDRTLRNWLNRWYGRLFTLGIVAELKYTGSFTSQFYNTIVLMSSYPNVELNIGDIRVGDTADFYIENTKIKFNNLGAYLNLRINGRDYGQSTQYSSGNTPDITSTLSAWLDQHRDFLEDFGIRARVFNTILRLDLKKLTRLDVEVNTGKINLPGIFDFVLTNSLVGNEGVLVSSNEIIIPDDSDIDFRQSGFSTGMALSINNTPWTWMNQDYTIQYLDKDTLNLSYQGPFWSLTSSGCFTSGFKTISFDLGFNQNECIIPISPTGSTGSGEGGPFDPTMFDPTMFTVTFNPNGYTFNTYDLSIYAGTTGLVDIKYIQLTNSIYAFGDNLVVIDSTTGEFIELVEFMGNTASIEMEFNPINSLLYCLSINNLWIVDSTTNQLIQSVTFSNSAYDLEINPFNGDVYITFSDAPLIQIWDQSNVLASTLSTTAFGNPGKMVFNTFEGDMYVTCGTSSVIRINGSVPPDDFVGGFSFPSNSNRTIQTQYNIPNLVIDTIFYEPVEESIFVWSSTNLWRIDNGMTYSLDLTYSGGSSYFFFNNLTGQINISNGVDFTRFDLSGTYSQTSIANFGYLDINQYDGDIYMSSQIFNNILVISGSTGLVLHSEPMSAPTGKIVYNPERKSVWTIQPSTNSIIEMEVELNLLVQTSTLTSSVVGEGLYGTLDPNYTPRDSMWIKTREYFRRPRENFEGDVPVKYYWRWMTDEVKDFFLYDFSGSQLPTSGSYAYNGPKPLTNAALNTSENKNIQKTGDPEYQRTIFDKIEWSLSYIDDVDDVSVESESLELFIGYKSEREGSIRNVLQLFKSEDIDFTINSNQLTKLTFETLTDNSDKRGIIRLESNDQFFTGRGLKPGQNLVIYITDTTNQKNQWISSNNAILVKIRGVFTKYLIVDFFNIDWDFIEKESTVINNYPKSGNTTYLSVRFKVKDLEIGRFITYGETIEEDERFKIELGNIGKLISPNEVFIFKEYDILEGGIDWNILNRKRKEMLMNRNSIYPYIGAYKSLINAINYFGYNDLQLNEYYRNTNGLSKDFGKLFKVEIPDIFDNTIKGWNEKDFLSKYLPNDGFEETNMFNLTYFITDKEGNYILNYSLDEIIIKLQGLKYWLKRNIVPLTHKIMDITGVSYFNGSSSIQHTTYDSVNIVINENMTPVTFKLNEAYLLPINSGSTVYNCVLDLYSIIPGLGSEKEVKPNNEFKSRLSTPDTFDIKIRTYKTYKEWVPYTTYNLGDKVIYFDKIYISVKNSNRINNPRKWESVGQWTPESQWEVGSVVEWNREFFSYSGLGTNLDLSPDKDPQNWLNITTWKEIDLEPVQYITEFRGGLDLRPFNFTIDSNIDPMLVIEVTSHSGYGGIYSDKKNYLIRGLKDITDDYSYLDSLGPLIQITPIEKTPILGGGGDQNTIWFQNE
jgi:hypothetical protein